MSPARFSEPFVDWAARRSASRGAVLVADAVVIGSGYGAAVAALRLAQEGRNVLVLERGAEFQPGDFPNHLGQLPKFLRAHGLDGTVGSLGGVIDLRLGLGMGSIVANGLGGGSLVNAGVMMRPDADVFAQPAWPAEIRHDLAPVPPQPGLGLDAAFERAADHLKGEWFDDRVTPEHPRTTAPSANAPPVSDLPKAQALQRMGRAMKRRLVDAGVPDQAVDFEARPARVTIDLEKCKRCGDCFAGCNVPGAKKTLLTTYLHEAQALGATLLTGALVYTIKPTGPRSAQEWELRVLPTDKERHALKLKDAVACEGYTVRASLVVVAAGTFGSTELLQRSQELATGFTLSPALGTRLSGNGDSLSVLADLTETVQGVGQGADEGLPAVGPTITTMLDLRGRQEIDQRVVIQEGAVPGALARIYAELLATTWTLRHLGTFGREPRANAGLEPLAATMNMAQHTQLLLAMGHDGSRGRIVWLPAMDGAVPFWPEPEQEATFRRQQQLFDAAGRDGGGVHLHPPTWRLVHPDLARAADGELPPPTMLGVHPLGGCPMGDRFESGVVDHRGQVWCAPARFWDNLYVLDGSIVPTSLGCNPLWTITALAERAMAHRVPATPARIPAGRTSAAPATLRPAKATTRPSAPPVDMEVLERLELTSLAVRGQLRHALGAGTVESDIRLSLHARDWLGLWEQSRHRVERVTGILRLVVPPPAGQPQSAPLPTLEYQVASGHVDLFSPDPLLRTLRRVLRLPRVLLTWWLLRGRRDHAERKRRPRTERYPVMALLALAWTTTEVRYVRYDLELRCKPGPWADKAPPGLLLTGKKVVTYAASWREIVRHLWLRWTRPAARLPGELRASLLHQLTQPTIRLDASRWQQKLPWSRGLAQARYDFDEQQALQRTPARVLHGGDSTVAGFAALAYPAFLVRYLLQARLMDFRLPTYSDAPAIDAATQDDVVLRVHGADGAPLLVHPQEFPLEVPLGLSSSDDGTEPPRGSKLRLRLWRYARTDAGGQPCAPACEPGTWCDLPVRRAKSVLLMHAFDMSGLSFTFKSTEQNFAEHLYENGWEVWILDSRMSPRTQAVTEPCTIDQLGFIDAPRAVDFIQEQLLRQLGAGAPLQTYGFGQCMGAAALLIGLLGGRLSHPHVAGQAYESTTRLRPQMPKLAGLVTSQTHPFIVGSRSAQSRTWVPTLLRDWAGRTMVPLAVRGPVTSVVESLADRLFAGFPVPEGERCHQEGERHRIDDDCATCRRIRFLLGAMFLHANLNIETHRQLPRLFGSGSVRLFAQGAKFFVYEKICSEDGHNVYATDDAIGRYLALPLRFLHGSENGLFDAESATRSAAQYRRVHPRWADRYGLPAQGREGPQVCDLIDGYGHVDVLIGRDANRATYGRLSALLETAWTDRAAAPVPARNPAQCLVARFPRSGPFLGPVVASSAGPVMGISFIVDDTHADRPKDAVALVDAPGVPPQLVPLTIREMKVAVPARDDCFQLPPGQGSVGLRVASGQIALSLLPPGQDVRIRCLSYAFTTETPMRLLRWDDGQRSAPDVRGIVRLQAAQADADDPPIGLQQLEQAIRRAQKQADALRAESLRPFPRSLSQQVRFPRTATTMLAHVPARLLQQPQPGEKVVVAVGCCRYSGFPYERERADQAYGRLLQYMEGHAGADLPQMLFLLGDQIYADSTAGLVDSLSPVERFFYRHHEAFTTVAARKLFSSLPTVCLPDDHEFINGYPLGRPLMRRGPEASLPARPWPDERELAARGVALQAIDAYQMGQLPAAARTDGYCRIDRGEVRFFVLDTRSRRQRLPDGTVTTLTAASRQAFADWVKDIGQCELACLVTSSVLVPGLRPGADPANMGPVDTMQCAQAERQWLLAQLVEHLPGRFVLLSGDYHLSFAGALRLDGRIVGAAVVAPPFYAPLVYANAAPDDVFLDEGIPLPGLALGTLTVTSVSKGVRPGSGYGLLDFQRLPEGWQVRLGAHLIDFERHERPQWEAWPEIELGPLPDGSGCSQGPGPAPAATASPAVEPEPREPDPEDAVPA